VEEQDISVLEDTVKKLDEIVRDMKSGFRGSSMLFMETDPKALVATKLLQDATRKLLQQKYGTHKHYRVQVDFEIQPSLPSYTEATKFQSIVIEMAPIALIPVSVYNFMEMARTWTSGAMHIGTRPMCSRFRLKRPPLKETLAFKNTHPNSPTPRVRVVMPDDHPAPNGIFPFKTILTIMVPERNKKQIRTKPMPCLVPLSKDSTTLCRSYDSRNSQKYFFGIDRFCIFVFWVGMIERFEPYVLLVPIL
jgi:hypothetical protein